MVLGLGTPIPPIYKLSLLGLDTQGGFCRNCSGFANETLRRLRHVPATHAAGRRHEHLTQRITRNAYGARPFGQCRLSVQCSLRSRRSMGRLFRRRVEPSAFPLLVRAPSSAKQLEPRQKGGACRRRAPREADRILFGLFGGRRGVVGFLALCTKAGKMDGIIRNPKAGALAIRDGQVVQARVF
jgi:hypothetical protein